MTVESLEDLKLIESPIQYRRQYTATAHLSFGASATDSAGVAFTLEHTPHGSVEVRVTVEGDLRYPLVPVVRELKKYIAELEKEGKLP